jgi:hypothetical protein
MSESGLKPAVRTEAEVRAAMQMRDRIVNYCKEREREIDAQSETETNATTIALLAGCSGTLAGFVRWVSHLPLFEGEKE